MSEKKDLWDKVSVISSALIPISIAIIGTIYSSTMKDAEIAISKDQLEITKLNTKVEQAKLVSSFLESLTSSDDSKKKLAIKAILLALPKDGASLVSTLSETAESKDIRQFASIEIEKFKLLNEFNALVLNTCYGSSDDFIFVDGGNGQLFSESKNSSLRVLVNLNNNEVSLDILNINPYAKRFANENDARKDLENMRECIEEMWLVIVKEGEIEKYKKALQRAGR